MQSSLKKSFSIICNGAKYLASVMFKLFATEVYLRYMFNFFYFLEFLKIEYSIFCLKTKTIGMTLVFFITKLWNPKIENAIWGVKSNIRPISLAFMRKCIFSPTLIYLNAKMWLFYIYPLTLWVQNLLLFRRTLATEASE